MLIHICHRLDECLDRARVLGGLTSFNAATGFVDYDGLSYVLNYLGGVLVMLGLWLVTWVQYRGLSMRGGVM